MCLPLEMLTEHVAASSHFASKYFVLLILRPQKLQTGTRVWQWKQMEHTLGRALLRLRVHGARCVMLHFCVCLTNFQIRGQAQVLGTELDTRGLSFLCVSPVLAGVSP